MLSLGSGVCGGGGVGAKAELIWPQSFPLTSNKESLSQRRPEVGLSGI